MRRSVDCEAAREGSALHARLQNGEGRTAEVLDALHDDCVQEERASASESRSESSRRGRAARVWQLAFGESPYLRQSL